MEKRNDAILRRVIENIWNRGDLDMADQLFAPSYVNHGGLIPDLIRGPEAMKITVALFRTAFPTLRVTIDRLTANGDSVEVLWAAGRTPDHLAAMGERDSRSDQLRGTTLSTLFGGKIMESWTDWDHMNALRRLDRVTLEPHT